MRGNTVAPDTPDDGEPPELSERFLAGMALSQTPQQQQIASEIYGRLAAGAQVDDIKDLIDNMMRVVAGQRAGERTAPSSHAGDSDSGRFYNVADDDAW
jgi:hypothetical protein